LGYLNSNIPVRLLEGYTLIRARIRVETKNDYELMLARIHTVLYQQIAWIPIK